MRRRFSPRDELAISGLLRRCDDALIVAPSEENRPKHHESRDPPERPQRLVAKADSHFEHHVPCALEPVQMTALSKRYFLGDSNIGRAFLAPRLTHPFRQLAPRPRPLLPPPPPHPSPPPP